jgi:hypothetical protein
MVSAVAGCVLHESEVRTWPVMEVTLSALLADLCLTDVTAAAAAESATAAAHPGAAPPDSVHSLRSGCPSETDPVCLALKEHGLTLLLVSLLLLRLDYRLTLPLVACHL